MPMRAALLWVLLSGTFLLGAAVPAAEDKPIRAMIVFDVSGSMRQSDPERSSVAAAQLFTDLARTDDVVGLAAFSGEAETLVPIVEPMDSSTKSRLQEQLGKLRFNGATTNLAAALEVGLAAFPKEQDATRQDMVLLLTDGQLDLGKNREAEETAALERIVQSLIPEYRRRGIALYTMAFTLGSDHDLLEQMAGASGGEFRFIADASTLHQAFGQMFIGSHQAESFPLEQNRILIDSSIQDLSLVFEKSSPGERIVLVTPGEQTLRSDAASPGTVWRSTATYELVNLHKPQSGEWLVERSGGTKKGVGIIGSSTLSVQVELGSTFIETGAKTTLRAFLHDQSASVGTIRREAGQTMVAEISTTKGVTSTLTLEPQPDGSFAATTPALRATGRYGVTVTATTPTLKRQRTTAFVVHPECLQASVASTVPVTAHLVLSGACPKFKALAIEAEYTTADRSMQRVPLRLARDGVYEANIPALASREGGRVFLHVRGERDSEGPFKVTKGPWTIPMVSSTVAAQPPPAQKEPEPVVTRIVNKLLIVNGLLVLLGVMGYAVYRYMARKAKVVHGRSSALDSDNDRGATAPR